MNRNNPVIIEYIRIPRLEQHRLLARPFSYPVLDSICAFSQQAGRALP